MAVQALYQIDLRGEDSPDALRQFFEHSDSGARAKEFAAALVSNVRAQRERIDALITKTSEHWRFERLSPVDLNVLRVATAELLQAPRPPTSVVIDEAIEIARRFGTADSAVFVNGVLDQIATELGVQVAPEERSARHNG